MIALLLSFADLAEHAAGRSVAIRWLLLWILRRAEVLLEEYVLDVTGDLPPVLYGLTATGNEPEDALRLAAGFRAMAAMLGALMPFAWQLDLRYDWRPGRRGFMPARVAVHAGPRLGGLDPAAHDTS